ncbi:MAG TPA: YkgJ family cysteine cluster protein, partial [Chitinivibrionales bacterium]
MVTVCYFYPMAAHPLFFTSIAPNLTALYKRIDLKARKLMEMQASRFKCRRGCTDCCVDEISVFPVEADNIRLQHADLLKNNSAHPAGAYAFLDEQGACRIYEARPYVC